MSEADEVIARLQRSAETARRVLDETSGAVRGSGRADASAQNRVSPEWTVRYTWKIVNGLPHPEHTFANHWTESRAIDAASSMLLNFDNSGALHLTAAHVKGPGKKDWIKVE
jgi:hypothetical protein